MSSRPSSLVALTWALAAAACGGKSPTAPTPPVTPPAALVLTCPAPVSALSVDGNPVTVTFPVPTATGGTAPVTTTCEPASGTAFPVGTTTSSCTARDAAARTATCSVSIAVAKVPRLTVSSLDAFGDSITQGVFADCQALAPPALIPATALLRFQQLLDVSRSYPTKLKSMLAARYSAQTIALTNDGLGGERVQDAAGRLSSALSAARPEVLLLQEGANNVNADDSAIFIAAALRELVKQGQRAGARVFVGALLPQRASDSGSCRSKAPNAAKVAEINAAIQAMAAGEGAWFVDLYAAFGGVPGDLIGPDGLHPNDAGYEKIAATFFDAIKQRFEN